MPARTLPPLPIVDEPAMAADVALQALTRADLEPRPINFTDDAPTGAAGGSSTEATPPQRALVGATRDRSPENPPPASSAGASKKSKRGGARPGAGRKASSTAVKGDEISQHTAARTGDLARENDQLRARVVELEAIAEKEQADFFALAAGETAETIALGAAAIWGDHCKITPEQKERLGSLWGKALAPMLAEHAAQMPMIAAAIATGGIVLEKVHAHRVAVAAATPAVTVEKAPTPAGA